MYRSDLLAGKRILITGGGTGLGKSMAAHLLELGAEIAICGRREDVLAATVDELGAASGGVISAHGCDIRDPDAVETMMSALFDQQPLDGLINNAAGNILAKSETLSPRALDAVVGIVLKGSANCTLAAGRRWLDLGHPGTVLSVTTTYAWTGSAFVLPSAMAKAGVLAMTQSLAVEWGGRGIRLNAIAPGPFPTKGAWDRLVPNEEIAKAFESRNPLRRPGDHRELTNLVAFLMADGSGYVNGDVITIDGGEWLKGAGQFSFLEEMMTDEDWAAMRPPAKSAKSKG
ncbi:MAG: SDR family oxidoreductase [Alphaproteobacteria bacterium]|nr:SDR family oxidoreductase [Alphaproteobacteria bacterium]